ncbi:MAG: hypothetical protein ACO2PN_21055 [Pyrobaculum sp.]|jgi:Arc/MetJ-type ribon-helix-helix transcriptional regulator
MNATIIRKTFTLTEKDIEIIKEVVRKCNYISDSEALRAIIRFFEEHAPCMSR